MRKLLISVAAVVTVGALILTGCPDDSPTAAAILSLLVAAPAGGASAAVDVVYGDATRTDCRQLTLAAENAFGQDNDGTGASLTFTE